MPFSQPLLLGRVHVGHQCRRVGVRDGAELLQSVRCFVQAKLRLVQRPRPQWPVGLQNLNEVLRAQSDARLVRIALAWDQGTRPNCVGLVHRIDVTYSE